MNQTMSEDRLLILDDDDLTGQTIRNVAEFAGMCVKVTSTPTDFFQILRDWQPTHIALDLVMPEMDGVEVLAELGDMQNTANIIITSGVGEQILQAAARSAAAHGLNVVGILPKPFSPRIFRELLQLAPEHQGEAMVQPQAQEASPDITEARLREAVNQHAITLEYQPKVECGSGALTGFEALARWHDPELGRIPPDKFIAVAEQCDLIDPLTLSIFAQAIDWFSHFRQHSSHQTSLAQSADVRMSLNISARSLPNLELFNELEKLCLNANLSPDSIMLELTETSAMDDPVASLDILTRLRMKGFHLSIDDFGTGFSSMLQLVRMPFSEVKVDKSFVMTARDSRESRLVITAVSELAHSLGMKVTAEGIENHATLQFLQQQGCDIAQGYYIARPMPAEAIEDWLEKRARHLEEERVNTLHNLNILDTASEQRFDRITRLASRLFNMPMSMVSLVDNDRQWFKSSTGVDVCETTRAISFCTHAIEQNDIFVIPDALNDSRFAENPLVLGAPFIRFYAGCPLKASTGEKLGTLCVLDTKPRIFSDQDKKLLTELAVMVEEEIATNKLLAEDHLTGLLNRRGFEARAAQMLQLCLLRSLKASLIYIDLDNFKQINDSQGHQAGDDALIQFSKLLVANFRESDLVARVGGDEFVVLLVHDSAETDYANALKRLENTIIEYNDQVDQAIELRYSKGIAHTESAVDYDLQQLYALADEQMYEHKRWQNTDKPSADGPNN